ncbi:hypothetical protein SELR_21440 [Selenomonas ruminantium subsp. lactilytica TAM6421]|uniref:Uncharacterized protein n=1 Tax=Selenomonas ruminantium subsp. lactilytica (strain NBRC 103574 / TAM6421) TaxID=927704 RepID=I0GSW5_SELRL|nr:hypothetical protein [Selenomonas ruminantium]BAL83852.1 hypothetical protein SELR_21440 [Selenomonas ruminantium subsp. lactilytica TAM6421]
MVRKLSRLLALSLLLAALMSTVCLAAGKVMDEDFSCKGVLLGDSESVLQSKWGEPMYDKLAIKQGVKVRTYVYEDRSEASVAVADGKVVDFTVDMEKYVARNNVRQGATKYWLEKTYGKKQRQFLDGAYYLIYERDNHPHQHLLLKIDPEDGHLLDLRITGLPLTEAERAAMQEAGESMLQEYDHDEGEHMNIDMSSLPQDDTVSLEGLGR